MHQFGTGTLLAIADENFLITASHVFEFASRKKCDLYIGGANGTLPVALGGELVSTDDYFDVAVIQIDEDVVKRLASKSFLRIGDVTFDRPKPGDLFTLFGFPTVLSVARESRLGLSAFQMTSQLYDGDTSALGEFHPECHFCLMASLDQTKDVHGNAAEFVTPGGASAQFPRDLGGISGCSVWKIGNLNTIDRETKEAKLVGVQTGVYSTSECIKVTRWGIVAKMIEESMPRFARAIRMDRE